MDLQTLSSKFLSLNETNLQFDFSRDNNGQILMQVFKGADIIRWKWNIPCSFNDVVSIIHFHKDKENNESNYKRFIESDLFSEFETVKIGSENMFYSIIDNTDSRILADNIQDIISEIYLLNSFSFELNAW